MSAGARRAALWGALFLINFALIATGHILDLIEPPVPWILMAANMVLVIPYVRAIRAWQETSGRMTPAMRRYNQRFLAFSAIYMVAMIVGGNLADSIEPGSALLWLTATAPLVPVLGMIWTMGRFLVEEEDEYQRHRAVNAALWGLALVLCLGSSWGFLEMFGLLPHVWAWWVFPAFALGMGVSMCWPRDRAGDEA